MLEVLKYLQQAPPHPHMACFNLQWDRLVPFDNGEFTDEYVEYSIKNNENFRDIYNNGRGVIHLADPKKIIVDFDVIEDGEKYQLYKYSQDFAGWQNNEADAMEAETLLSMKTYLMEKLLASSIELPTDINDLKGKQIQGWDGVLSSGDTLYLLEAKHSMSVEKVKEMASRVEHFPQISNYLRRRS
jgi:hypothetical protein